MREECQKWDVKYSAVIPYSRQTERRMDLLHRSRLYTHWCTLSPWRSKRACSLVKHWLADRGGLICYCHIIVGVISFYASLITLVRPSVGYVGFGGKMGQNKTQTCIWNTHTHTHTHTHTNISQCTGEMMNSQGAYAVHTQTARTRSHHLRSCFMWWNWSEGW